MRDQILIIDDDKMTCGPLARRLTREGYECLTVSHAKEAFSQLYQHDFSLVLLDLDITGMTGIEFLKRMFAIHPNQLVIVMTEASGTDRGVEAVQLGAYQFVVKPVHLDFMAVEARRALEKGRLVEEVERYHQHFESTVEERTSRLQESYLILKKTRLDAISVLVEAIDAKDPYTRGHSDRVRKMSLEIAPHLGFKDEKLEVLEYGALLHDIGKIGIKDEILRKPGPLTPKQYKEVQEHPLIGVRIVEGIEFFKDKIPMIRNHHERFDGKGYPDKLAGKTIPLEARIIAITDSFDAMTSMRPHRRAMSIEDALMEMGRGRGTQFDPKILEIFLEEQIYEMLKIPGAS